MKRTDLLDFLGVDAVWHALLEEKHRRCSCPVPGSPHGCRFIAVTVRAHDAACMLHPRWLDELSHDLQAEPVEQAATIRVLVRYLVGDDAEGCGNLETVRDEFLRREREHRW